MSTQIAPPQLDEAYALLHEHAVEAPFFQKLASDYGIVPADAEQAEALLDIGYMLMAKQNQAQVKEASSVTQLLTHVKTALATELGQTTAPATRQIAVNMLSQHPQLKQAALLMSQASSQ